MATPAHPPTAHVPDHPHSDPAHRVWTDARLLGHGALDATHQDFYEVVFRLLTCTQDTAWTALQAFETHARAHFRDEEDWMRDTAFPSLECHADEHDKVLASLAEVKHALTTRAADHQLLHRFADHLFAWFPGHADYMDSALATWLSKKRFGAKPVVLKRQASA